MLTLPNYPLRRVRNYMTDWPWQNFRWVYINSLPGTTHAEVRYCCVDGDTTARSKSQDPDWRRNWRWAVFKSIDDPLYICIEVRSGLWLRTFFQTSGQCFAVRVGPEPIRIVTVWKEQAWIPNRCGNTLLTRAEVQKQFPDATLH